MKYTPNKVPLKTRLINIGLASFLFFYGGYGIYHNDIYIPARRGSGSHFHDGEAVILFASMLCACVVLLSVVADHYDERKNEHAYKFFGDLFKALGWVTFGLVMVSSIL